MLTLLLLLLLSTPNSSLTTPVAISSSNNNNVTSGALGPTSTDDRSMQDIVWSCLATIFACTWVAVHSNLPGPWDSEWTMLKRRVTIMIYAMLAPEFVTMWAMLQWMAARRIASEFNIKNYEQLSVYNENTESCVKNSWTTIIKNAVIEWFKGPDLNQPRDYRWTSTHGFFIQMGGFILCTDDKLERVLTFNDLQELIKKEEVDVPRITEDEINDRRQRDFLTKPLAVLQTTWFVLQCVARWSSNIPVTELEVVTLAFAALNVFTYGLWWNKPQNVQFPLSIPWNAMDGKWYGAHRIHGDGRGVDRTEEGLRERIRMADELERDIIGERIRDKDLEEDELERWQWEREMAIEALRDEMRQRDRARISKIRQEAEESLRERERVQAQINAWNQMVRENIISESAAKSALGKVAEKGQVREIERSMRRARPEVQGTSQDTHRSWARLRLREAMLLGWGGWFQVPWILLRAFLRPLSKMSGFTNNVLGSQSLRIPMFWKEQTDSRVDFPVLAIGVLFGTLHLIPWWTGSFLTVTERWLWRSSALTITVEPMLVFALRLADALKRRHSGWLTRTYFFILRIPVVLGIPLYILARLVLLTLAFTTLRDLPPAAFANINWTTFLPHV